MFDENYRRFIDVKNTPRYIIIALHHIEDLNGIAALQCDPSTELNGEKYIFIERKKTTYLFTEHLLLLVISD